MFLAAHTAPTVASIAFPSVQTTLNDTLDLEPGLHCRISLFALAAKPSASSRDKPISSCPAILGRQNEAAGWAGVKILPLVLRFAWPGMGGPSSLSFVMVAGTTDLGKGSRTILAKAYLMPSGERVSMRSDRERLKFIKPQEPRLVLEALATTGCTRSIMTASAPS